MNEMELEQKLRAFDYTTLDTVKENLKDKLLAMHRRDNQKYSCKQNYVFHHINYWCYTSYRYSLYSISKRNPKNKR